LIIPEILCDDFECQIRFILKLKEGDTVITDVYRGVLNCCGNNLLIEYIPVDLKGSGQYDYATDQ
jgi:hypothetical protein